MRLIYALSPTDSDNLSYHSADTLFRGTRSIYLRHTVAPVNTNTPDDALVLDVRSANVSISTCKYFIECALVFLSDWVGLLIILAPKFIEALVLSLWQILLQLACVTSPLWLVYHAWKKFAWAFLFQNKLSNKVGVKDVINFLLSVTIFMDLLYFGSIVSIEPMYFALDETSTCLKQPGMAHTLLLQTGARFIFSNIHGLYRNS